MCPKCKTPIFESDSRFCRWCGMDLIGLMSECSDCHIVMHADDLVAGKNYCPECANLWDPIHPARSDSYWSFWQRVPAAKGVKEGPA